jgi:4-hydroxy-tetrahydrodipicolinate synthase
MKVYGACDELLYGSYVSGASGAISALVTVAPRLCVDQWRAFKSGDQTKAMEIHKKIFPLVKCYSEKPFPGKVKELLNLQGRKVGKGRRPILEPTAAEKKHIKTSFKKAGLI